jgi:hypothetical protein
LQKGGVVMAFNSILNDVRLSSKAKGIFLFAWNFPKNFSYNEEIFLSSSSDGTESLRSGIKELEKYGYLVRTQIRQKGKIIGTNWEFKFGGENDL